jgi:hypothetical protein
MANKSAGGIGKAAKAGAISSTSKPKRPSNSTLPTPVWPI